MDERSRGAISRGRGFSMCQVDRGLCLGRITSRGLVAFPRLPATLPLLVEKGANWGRLKRSAGKRRTGRTGRKGELGDGREGRRQRTGIVEGQKTVTYTTYRGEGPVAA